MKHLIIILSLWCTAATAVPVLTWSGAGPNACHGQCPQEWAESHLTPSELSELKTIRETQPEPQAIEIQDGDIFRLSSYFKDGKPKAYRTTTVTVLQQPTGAQGWHMNGWSWVKLDECSNWTIVEHQGLYSGTPVNQRVPQFSYPPVWVTTPTPLPIITTTTWSPPTITTLWKPPVITITNPPIVVTTPPVPVPAVSLPASFWFLFTALGLVALFNGKMRS